MREVACLAVIVPALALQAGCIREQAKRSRAMAAELQRYARHQVDVTGDIGDAVVRYLSYQGELATRLGQDLRNYARHQAEKPELIAESIQRYVMHECEMEHGGIIKVDFVGAIEDG